MPRIKVIVTVVPGADLEAALATVDRQVYDDLGEVTVVAPTGEELPEAVIRSDTLEAAIAAASAEVDYLWILHSDARPRPDALAALVAEVERNDASLGGSKLLVAGTRDELESVGSATDVFGEPYTGLDEGEIDLQQYDVVREVAFVSSVSMLVRRDLAQGLRGLDPMLEPVAAGLDFSQRVRLAGGRVITVPSSEVYHQDRCGHGAGGWREEAGRLRAMLKAYRLITLAWVIPFAFVVAVIDSLANLLLLRWRPLARHAASWGWNLVHLPSTIGTRRRFHPVRAVGDEELFRFQARGSVRLRDVGAELTDRVLFMFDDERALARGTRRVRSNPGIWGAVLAALLVVLVGRALVFGGVPNVGWSFPFEAPTVALSRFLGGWNDAALGSPAAVHPSTGLAGLASLIWFGSEGAARTLLTLGFGLIAVLGMGRLCGRLGFRGPGRYLAGLVMIAGPGTATLTGAGSWAALGAAALTPWAVRSVFLTPSDTGRGRVTQAAWAVLLTTAVASMSPVLALAPLLVALAARAVRFAAPRVWLGLVALLGAAVALPFLIGDPGWLTDGQRRLGIDIPALWPILAAVAAIPLFFLGERLARFGFMGAVLALGSMLAIRLPIGGPGPEEALAVIASLGAAFLVSGTTDRLGFDARRGVGYLAGVAVIAVSLMSMIGGRLGLPAGDMNDQLAFATTLAHEGGPGRLLLISTDRSQIPGEAEPGPGFWYRLVDASGMTQDEVWLPPALPGDSELRGVIDVMASGSELRPGAALGPYAVDWLVLLGDQSYLDAVLGAQLDLVPTPLDPAARVYENPHADPVAAGGGVFWGRSGTGYAGAPVAQPVRLSSNYDRRWGPAPEASEWAVVVDGGDGVARFRPDPLRRVMAIAPLALALAAGGVIVARRVKR